MKPPYTENGYSQYGAQMGRRDLNAINYDGGKLHLRRVPLDSGGYDPGGAYWGTGTPLWCAWGWLEDGDCLECYTRAATRHAAKEAFDGILGGVPPAWLR